MKKFLALFLVLVIAFSCILVSCNKNEEGEPEDTEDDGGDFIGFGTYATTTGTGDGENPVQTGNTHTDFTWTDDTAGTLVYVAVPSLNVRDDTNTSEESYVASIKMGESFKRTRYNAQWTEIEYNGEKRFVSTQFITTNDGHVVFTALDAPKKMYINAEKSLNIREWTDISADNVVVSVLRGVEIEQTHVSKDGKWAKVKFVYTKENQKTETYEGYCKLSYLSETKPTDSSPIVTTASPSLG
ncbi:MAG: hypothetical protein J6A83_05015 [Clostridia bacterium]|nr:hypothetical protein [Clostridia bacterium]